MSKLARWNLSHNRIVVPFWLILTLVGFASAQRAIHALSTQFTTLSGEGITTGMAIANRFGRGGTRGQAYQALWTQISGLQLIAAP